jgi:hypothetical protein
MAPFLRMLEVQGLSLGDAEAGGFDGLAEAVQRCSRCLDDDACTQWLEWRGKHGRAPLCRNGAYFHWLRERSRPR